MKSCCIIVTYNRKNDLARCVRQCLSLSQEPDVLIVDNASTDGTFEFLLDQGLLGNSSIQYHRLKENIGGAGGFSTGLEIAYNNNYSYFFLMDDDGYPRNASCLMECIKASMEFEDAAIVNSYVFIDDGSLSFSLNNCSSVEEANKKVRTGDLIFDAIAPFNGTLLSRKIVEEIGFPKSEFFIKGDEFEYVLRAKAHGFKWVTACKAEFYHPKFVQSEKKLLWKSLKLSNEPAWKEYCRARNYCYIYRNYFGNMSLLKHIGVELVRCMFFDVNRLHKTWAVLSGLSDGLHGSFSNQIVKRWMV